MHRFDFHLARLLRLREAKMRGEEFALQVARSRLAELKSELETLKRTAENAGRQIKAQQWVDPGPLLHLGDFSKGVESELKACLERIARQEQIVQKQAAVVLAAQREVRLLEKLREKKYEEWKVASAIETERDVSDFLAAQWARRAK